MIVAFRADASPEIGTGHLMRCLTLANVLRARGADTLFICRQIPVSLGTQLQRQKHRLVMLVRAAQSVDQVHPVKHASWLGTSWRADAEETLGLITRLGQTPDWLVVDHYALDKRWERALRPVVGSILAIDDLADRDHDCEILVDQNPHAAPERRYSGKIAKSCRLLLGPRYALLRPEFAKARAEMTVRGEVPQRILVFMGGIDATNTTRMVLLGIAALHRPDLAVDVVATASNSHVTALGAEFGGLSGLTLSLDVQDMARRLALADIAIGAGGSAMLERACVGVPSLTIAIAENQEPGAEALGARGSALYLGRAADLDAMAVRDALSVMLRSRTLRRSLMERSAALVDGRGAERIAPLMLGRSLALRLACADDSKNVFEWRNDERTRKYSGDGDFISLEQHERWFTAMLIDSARKMLIAEEGGVRVGVVRYDIAGDKAEVSIYLVPGNSGRGLGESILVAGEAWLSRACPDVRELRAVVRRENAASLRIFESAGFEPHSTVFSKRVSVNA